MNKYMKHMKWQGALSVVLLAAFVPIAAVAETVVRTGDSVSIGVNQIVGNNLYAAAGSVSHSGEVKGDVYAVAGTVTINGPVGEDLTVLGGTVQTHADVGGDVRIIGGDAVIAGNVGGDLFVLGGRLQLLSSAKVSGNVYFYGGEAEIEGQVAGSLMGQADTFSINSAIGGADLSAGKIILGDQANIKGDLRYQSGEELERAMGATVEGQIQRSESADKIPERSNGSLVMLLIWFFTAVLTWLFFRSSSEHLLASIKKDPARVGLIGVLGMIAGPIVALILIATVLGAWAGIALLLSLVLLIIASSVLLPVLLGGYLLDLYRKNHRIDIWSVLIGMAALAICLQLSFVGGFLVFIGLAVICGALLQRLYGILRSVS